MVLGGLPPRLRLEPDILLWRAQQRIYTTAQPLQCDFERATVADGRDGGSRSERDLSTCLGRCGDIVQPETSRSAISGMSLLLISAGAFRLGPKRGRNLGPTERFSIVRLMDWWTSRPVPSS